MAFSLDIFKAKDPMTVRSGVLDTRYADELAALSTYADGQTPTFKGHFGVENHQRLLINYRIKANKLSARSADGLIVRQQMAKEIEKSKEKVFGTCTFCCGASWSIGSDRLVNAECGHAVICRMCKEDGLDHNIAEERRCIECNLNTGA